MHQAPVVQKMDSAIHRINLYSVDSAIGFPNTYPLDSDLSTFQQPGPDNFQESCIIHLNMIILETSS